MPSARGRSFLVKRSATIDCEAGEPADSPMPTPMRASASEVTLEADPHSAVIALQNARATATMLRRLSRSATRAMGMPSRE
ncbi:hypothetical protein ACVWZR_008202 [Bradyrhizobium sp. i1.3.1]